VITARQFIEEIERNSGVVFVAQGDELLVLQAEGLTPQDRRVVKHHRPELVTALHGEDSPLRAAVGLDRYPALGFVRIPETRAWTHPEGDDVDDRILAGLVDFDVAERDATERRRQAGALPFPRREDATVTEVHPGFVTWTERKGQNVRDPFPKIRRS
jgi:hypothetical protein